MKLKVVVVVVVVLLGALAEASPTRDETDGALDHPDTETHPEVRADEPADEEEEEDDEEEEEEEEQVRDNGDGAAVIRDRTDTQILGETPHAPSRSGTEALDKNFFVNVCVRSRECSNRYGSCRTEGCNQWEDEVPYGCGKATNRCWCCVSKPNPECKTDYRCADVSGSCKKTCDHNEDRNTAVGCQYGCSCCVPKNQVCTTDYACERNCGRCKKECGSYETQTYDQCSGYGCKCCRSGDCKTDCTKSSYNGCRGACKKRCDYYETQQYSGCEGKDCICCVRDTKPERCVIDYKCENAGGSCKAECGYNEKQVVSGCYGGKKCYCCVPVHIVEDKCMDEWCSKSKGTCKKWCSQDEEEIDGACKGRNCWCCAPKQTECWRKRSCKKRGGKCSTNDCRNHETEVRGGCEGKNCKCCAPRVCRNNKKCDKAQGWCKKESECDTKSKQIIRGGCIGGGPGSHSTSPGYHSAPTDCVCCAPHGCVETGRCLRHGGACREKCTGHDHKISNCQGKVHYVRCSCCAAPYKAKEALLDKFFYQEGQDDD